MRTGVVSAAVAALMLFPGASARADAPDRGDVHAWFARCDGVVTPLGFLRFDAASEERAGSTTSIVDLAVWSDPDDPPVFAVDREQGATLSLTSESVSMSVPLEPSGVAFIDGELTPTDTSTWDDEIRDGNRWIRDAGRGTSFTLTGTVTLPGLDEAVPFGPDGCAAGESFTTRFVTAPHARVVAREESGFSGWCDLVGVDGASGVSLIGLDSDGLLSLDGWLTGSDGATAFVQGAGALERDGSVTFETTEFASVEAPPSSGSASLVVTDDGRRVNVRVRDGGLLSLIRGPLLGVTGSLTGSTGTFVLQGCELAKLGSRRIETAAAGPRPGGGSPVNDLPDGALTLQSGGRHTVSTRGALPASEGPNTCLAETAFGPVELPQAYTVWYRIDGTGAPVTIDTAGSRIGTVVMVAAGTPEVSPIACASGQDIGNGLFAPQGAVTVETVIGTTYWVQIGGYALSPVPYGVLKVAVR